MDAEDDRVAVFGLGGGREEPKLLKRPPPLLTFARLAGGSSDGVVTSTAAGVGRLTTILPGLALSTSFWNGFFEPAAAVGREVGMAASASDSESE